MTRREFGFLAASGVIRAAVDPPDYPPIPELSNVNSAPPAMSDLVVLSTSKRRLRMWAESDNTSKHTMVMDTPNTRGPDGGILLEYWDHQPPADYVLTLREFWRPVPGASFRVNPGDTYDRKVTHSWGITTTDSESISAALGISGGGLDASITATFEHSVTTEKADSQEVDQHIDQTPAGQVGRWLLWQLVHEIVALDRQGRQLPAGDKGQSNRKATVSWFGIGTRSGAWVYYPATRWLFPSRTYHAYRKNFPA